MDWYFEFIFSKLNNSGHATFFNKQIWLEIKSQLISKCLFVSSILPKNELENSKFRPSQPGQSFFVLFLEELKKQNVLSRLIDL